MFILCLAKCSHSFTSLQSTYGVFLSNSPFPKALTYLDRLSVPLSKTKLLKLFWLAGVLENLTKGIDIFSEKIMHTRCFGMKVVSSQNS